MILLENKGQTHGGARTDPMPHDLPKAYDPTAIEDRWAEYWVSEKLFAQPAPAAGEPSQAEQFSILLPPPNVTGRLHMGHMLNQAEMDILTRWRRMSGRRALWLPGTDHAGIATQMMVERQLVSEGKTRQELGREGFVERVWEWKRHYGGAILDQMKRLGASVDWQREYFTMDENLSVAVREAFVRLHEQGLIYRGAYIVNWCPRCQTAISDLEVVYDEHKGHLWEIRYSVLDDLGRDSGESITVATTRPETMLGDVAVAIHPEDEPGFQDSVRASLRDMIRINRNHPSILVWSMDNEVFFTEQSTLPKVRALLKQLVAYTHELDPTRPAAIGGCQRGDLDKLGDLAGYNGDGARLFLDPGIPNVVTEYGSTIADRPGNYEPGWGDLPTVAGQDQNQPYPWRYAWRSGEVLWCAFDHGSVASKRFGSMGMIDYFRLPKRQYFWYRNEYRHIPPPEWPANGRPAGLKLTADKSLLKSVDGTDDAQVIVTVVDQAGKALSNSPPVTLTIEFGPGEFPTGPMITFAPDSDIVIRDGQAAIEFRSYYAGQTRIRATSPGLQDATIEITSLGQPAFIPGQTPAAKLRPYVRFTGGATMHWATRLGLDNPTRASSEAPGHSARFANDGNATTFWQAGSEQPNAWWCVDLERMVTLTQTHLTFPTDGRWRYRVEISDDGNSHWKLVADQSHSEDTASQRTDLALKAVSGRFLRVTIVGHPAGTLAGLAEAEASGTLATEWPH